MTNLIRNRFEIDHLNDLINREDQNEIENEIIAPIHNDFNENVNLNENHLDDQNNVIGDEIENEIVNEIGHGNPDDNADNESDQDDDQDVVGQNVNQVPRRNDAVAAFNWISAYPYSYAKYSLSAFKMGQMTSLVHIIPEVYILCHTWFSPSFYNGLLRFVLFIQFAMGICNIPMRFMLSRYFKRIIAAPRSEAIQLTRNLAVHPFQKVNKSLSIVTYSTLIAGFLLVYFSRYFETVDSNLKYCLLFVTTFTCLKIIISSVLLFYYLKDALESGDYPTMLDEELNAIPLFSSLREYEDVCPICWCPIKVNDKVRQVLCPAKHLFHDTCIMPWIRKNTSCPVCRYDFADQLRGF